MARIVDMDVVVNAILNAPENKQAEFCILANMPPHEIVGFLLCGKEQKTEWIKHIIRENSRVIGE